MQKSSRQVPNTVSIEEYSRAYKRMGRVVRFGSDRCLDLFTTPFYLLTDIRLELCKYTSKYGHHIYQEEGSTGWGCQSCSWPAEQGIWILPCPRSRLRIWPCETGLAAPSRASLLISKLRLNLVLTYGIPPEFRGGCKAAVLHVHVRRESSLSWFEQPCFWRILKEFHDSFSKTGSQIVSGEPLPHPAFGGSALFKEKIVWVLKLYG